MPPRQSQGWWTLWRVYVISILSFFGFILALVFIPAWFPDASVEFKLQLMLAITKFFFWLDTPIVETILVWTMLAIAGFFAIALVYAVFDELRKILYPPSSPHSRDGPPYK